jgi:bacillolysin
MKSVFFLSALLSILSVSAQQAEEAKNYHRGNKEYPGSGGTRVLASGPQGSGMGDPGFRKGSLGQIKGLGKASEQAIHGEAKRVLENLLKSEFGAVGNEKVVPAGKVVTDKEGGFHARLKVEINGMEVEGAAIVLHTKADGTVYAATGEFVTGSGVASEPVMGADTAIDSALGQAEIKSPEKIGEATLTCVYSRNRNVYLAWKQLVEYTIDSSDKDGGLHRDIIFANTQNGDWVASHRQFEGAGVPTLETSAGVPTLETIDCQGGTSCTVIVSSSSNPINTGDAAVDAAHNYAIATYNYYWNNFGRDSMNGYGMTLRSRVHYDKDYDGANSNGGMMTYGDGGGGRNAWCMDADVVAHEMTHHVTGSSSGLVYAYESGALNEAWSDIFGAMVDRQEGATGDDIWFIGEDLYTTGTPGDALRNMADPASKGDYDFYPTRYKEDSDKGGVHTNSGIANLAFYLLVEGGTHPRDTTNINVPGIGFEAAAEIFHNANVDCLTPNSGFAAARYCTADIHGGENTEAVNLAWDAVGVPELSKEPIALTNGVTLIDQSGTIGASQQYNLTVTIGHSVECKTSGDNGDAGLSLRFAATHYPVACESNSNGSDEICTANAPFYEDDTTLYAEVYATEAYSGLTITCTISAEPVPPTPLVDGQALSGQEGAYRTSHFYTLNGWAGALVDCEIQGQSPDGKATLYMYLGTPEPYDADCSKDDGDYYAFCSVYAREETTVYAEVYGYRPYSNYVIKCTTQLRDYCRAGGL